MTNTVSSAELEFRQFSYDSADYRQALELRDQVLRQPLGKTLTAADTEGEQKQLHFGLFLQDRLVAGVIIKPAGSNLVTLRQMTVSEGLQNQGLGGSLIEQTELALRGQGVKGIQLAARQTAQNFYTRQGYHCVGEVFLLLDIPHIRMEKPLI